MRNKLGSVLWGLAFIAVGFGIAGNIFGYWSFDLFFDGWWTLFIIIPCGISIIQRGFNTGNSIGLTIGVLLLLSQQDILPWRFAIRLFLPILLVIIGLAIIFRPSSKRANYKNANYVSEPAGPDFAAGTNAGAYQTKVEYTVNTDNATSANTSTADSTADGTADSTADSTAWNTSCANEILAIFCGNNGSYRDREFKGASCTAVFGSVDLDLRGAIITKDVTINATAIFGGVEIFTDKNVQVVFHSVPICGGVDCHVPPRDKSLPKLFINCTAICGGIDIK